MCRVLKLRDIMGSDAGVVIARVRLPGLLVKDTRIFNAMLEFSTRAVNAELDDGVS